MGFIKTILKFGMYAGIFSLGYATHGCITADVRYDVRRYNEEPYLIDKKLGERIVIRESNGKMQAGSLEYRVHNILKDDRLQECLRQLKQNE